MAEPLVISLLSAKRSELSGLILDLERTAARHKAELVHLDATLRLFDPDLVPATIRPRGKAHRSTLFATGELTGFILDCCRDATAPISSRDLTERVMVKKGLDVNDRKCREEMQTRVRAALSAHRRRGVLECLGAGWNTRWAVAG